MDAWAAKLEKQLNGEDQRAGDARYEVSANYNSDRNLYLPSIVEFARGTSTDFNISYEFIESKDYRAIVDNMRSERELIEAGAYVKRGDKEQPIESFAEGLAWLMKEAKRGFNIQRYKGLGEMNPEQLWETTMDPESRRMLKVTIEDAINADQIFTTLMGDQVEPRREFIEDNALSVANLDV